MLANKLLAAMAGGEEKLYAEDVFSAYTYTGNGSTQTINNGIDLAGKGGMVWIKTRAASYGNLLADTARGTGEYLKSETTGANQASADRITAFNSNGFSLGTNAATNSALDFASWTFRKAAKFFDVVTYTGDGVAGRQIPHSLGVAPGMVIVKCTSTTGDWAVYHRSNTANPETDYLLLNSTAATADLDTYWNDTAPTSSVFSVGTHANVNTNAATYVAYLFAHDTGTDGLIQCGSFTVSSGTGTTEVNLGWEPQFLLTKYNWSGYNWNTYDSSRGWVDTTNAGNVNARLSANLSNAEATDKSFQPSATGFRMANSAVYPGAPVTILYLAIRRPNKPPTTGTQVYNAIARTGTGAAATVTGVGFAPDLVVSSERVSPVLGAKAWHDRLRGNVVLRSENTNNEAADSTGVTAYGVDGVSLGVDSGFAAINYSAQTYINHFFKRAPKVFDVVCDTGTGAAHTVSHNLTVVPELMIRKKRSAADAWYVYAGDATDYLVLNTTAATADLDTIWNDTAPTASVFTVGTNDDVNQSTGAFVTYLFATLAGISKVGTYTGTATTNAINCGFTTGARFVLIKRTDSTGDWYVWDTVRGIIAGNDPYLLLNSTAAEVTSTDYIDPVSTGFELSSTAPAAINANGGSFIYLAFS